MQLFQSFKISSKIDIVSKKIINWIKWFQNLSLHQTPKWWFCKINDPNKWISATFSFCFYTIDC